MAISAAEIAPIRNSKIIAVVVRPNGSSNGIVGYDSEKKAWIIMVKAPAEKDKANIELLRLLRKETGKTWLIKSGTRSKRKILAAISS